jgi:outer membrane protein OmpA-like peptidoglycan-associated protein
MTQYALLKTIAAGALVVGVAACSSAQDAAGQAGGAAQNAAGQAGQAAQNAAGQAAGAAQDAAGQAAGAAGQKIQELVQVHPVTFTSQSAELSSEDTQTLQQIAAVQKATGATVTISTHAGYPDAEQAQQLSRQRADNIVKAMQDAGADASKLKTQPTGNSTVQGDQALRTEISAS